MKNIEDNIQEIIDNINKQYKDIGYLRLLQEYLSISKRQIGQHSNIRVLQGGKQIVIDYKDFAKFLNKVENHADIKNLYLDNKTTLKPFKDCSEEFLVILKNIANSNDKFTENNLAYEIRQLKNNIEKLELFDTMNKKTLLESLSKSGIISKLITEIAAIEMHVVRKKHIHTKFEMPEVYDRNNQSIIEDLVRRMKPFFNISFEEIYKIIKRNSKEEKEIALKKIIRDKLNNSVAMTSLKTRQRLALLSTIIPEEVQDLELQDKLALIQKNMIFEFVINDEDKNSFTSALKESLNKSFGINIDHELFEQKAGDVFVDLKRIANNKNQEEPLNVDDIKDQRSWPKAVRDFFVYLFRFVLGEIAITNSSSKQAIYNNSETFVGMVEAKLKEPAKNTLIT